MTIMSKNPGVPSLSRGEAALDGRNLFYIAKGFALQRPFTGWIAKYYKPIGTEFVMNMKLFKIKRFQMRIIRM
jgi:hypothetical protein